MAKGAYIGVNNVARKIKKGYIGVDNTARKIKKGYIGVGGAARLFYSLGPPMITSRLNGTKYCDNVILASINDKYLLVQDYDNGSQRVYDKSLTVVYSGNRSYNFYGANSVGSYGVLIPKTTSEPIYVYTDSLTLTYVDFGTTTGYSLSPGNIKVGDYIVFNSRAINSSLTLFSDLPVSVENGDTTEKYLRVGAQVGNWGCFSNGWGKIGTINTSLTTGTVITESSNSLYNKCTAWASAGNSYAIAVNGDDDDESGYPYNKKVWAVDASLTLREGLTSTDARYGLGSFTLGDYACFSGGGGSSTTGKTKVDVFDTSLVLTMNNYRTVDSYNVAGGSFGDMGVFYGGMGVTSKSEVNNIDIMTL